MLTRTIVSNWNWKKIKCTESVARAPHHPNFVYMSLVILNALSRRTRHICMNLHKCKHNTAGAVLLYCVCWLIRNRNGGIGLTIKNKWLTFSYSATYVYDLKIRLYKGQTFNYLIWAYLWDVWFLFRIIKRANKVQ